MRYPEYEDLLADSCPGDTEATDIFQDQGVADPDLEALLTESQRQERKRIDAELDQIERQLQSRTRIHEEAVGELEDILQDETDRLQRLQRPSVPADRVIRQKRQVSECEQQLQDVRRSHWQDREQLERERRRLRRDLRELQDTDLSVFF
jgi:sigma54-dependent transcription regulator